MPMLSPKDTKPGDPPVSLVCSERLFPALQQATPSQSHVAHWDGDTTRDLCLLEVEEDQLQDIINERFVMKGSGEDEAVLCNQGRTYGLKAVFSTNMMLLIPPPSLASGDVGELLTKSPQTAVVKAVANGHIETFATAPRLLRLKEMLHAHPYTEEGDEQNGAEGGEEDGFEVHGNDSDSKPYPQTGDHRASEPTAVNEVAREKRPHSEDDTSGRNPNKFAREGKDSHVPRHLPGYTWQEIVAEVQASEEEIKAGLSSLQAVQLGGRWRVVAVEVMSEVLNCLVLTALAKGWPMSGIPESEAVRECEAKGFREEVVRHCLRESSKGSKTGRDSEVVWELDEKRVCVDYARKLLKNGTRWRVPDFLQAWDAAVPASMSPSLSMLQGMAVQLPGVGPEPFIRYLPRDSLPAEPAQRFQHLFDIRSHWLLADLEPFLRDLEGPGQSIEKLLFSFTRKIQESTDSTPLYCAR